MKTRQRLKVWLEDREASQSSLAAQLGVPRQHVSAWIKGSARPPVWVRVRLEEVTLGSVRADDWMTPAEKAKLAASRLP